MKILQKSAKTILNNLEEYGFEFANSSVVGQCGDCYEKVIDHGIYALWVSVSPENKIVYFYDEYDCGGEIWQDQIDIPDDMDIDSEKFIEWLDEEIVERIRN